MGVLVVWCDLTHDPIDGSIIFKTFTKTRSRDPSGNDVVQIFDDN